MEIKQRGSALGYKILLFIYSIFGYDFVAFILNFVAFYYLLFAPSVRKSMRSYYKQQNLQLSYITYFKHLRNFALSIFDRFVSQIKPQDLSFCLHDENAISLLNQNGGIILLSHVGSWSSAANCLTNELPSMNIVMKESTKKDIRKVEKNINKDGQKNINIIDLNQSPIVANIQIANVLMKNELVALMADRVANKNKKVEVTFLNSKALINKSPFEIANKTKKPLVAIFVTSHSKRKYDIYFEIISGNSIETLSQEYANKLEEIVKKQPLQWYNFYDFFKENR